MVREIRVPSMVNRVYLECEECGNILGDTGDLKGTRHIYVCPKGCENSVEITNKVYPATEYDSVIDKEVIWRQGSISRLVNSSELDTWDNYFLNMLPAIAWKSKDPSTKCGALVVNPKKNKIISTGYNGFPKGIADTPERLNNRELKYPLVIHGELNALLHAHEDIEGFTMYVSRFPCDLCSLPIIQTGITRVVAIHHKDYEERWSDMIQRSLDNFNESKVRVVLVEM